jgi:hypothetical protein
MLKIIIVTALITLAALFSGCMNSPMNFKPALGVNMSLYNRGGSISAPAQVESDKQTDETLIETEGGGEVAVDPEAVRDASEPGASGVETRGGL